MTVVRLNKFLADSGLASRRKSEELILAGRITVNGSKITELAFSVNTESDTVLYDGEQIRRKEHIYFLVNKPKGYITTTTDDQQRRTVLELVPSKEKVFPVGRLDFNTTGVLLITNDGDFSNFILHPSHHIPRSYQVVLDKPLLYEDRDKLLQTVYLKDGKGKFSSVEYKTKNRKVVIVSTFEGRNHFVKRMFSSLGYMVDELERIAFGTFTIKGIPRGAYHQITSKEIERFYETYRRQLR